VSKRLLGLDFADLDVPGAAAWLARRGPSARFGYVVTPNADHLVRAHREADLAWLYRDALLCLLDSRVVAGAAWLLSLPVPCVAPGSDLTELLLSRHVCPDEPVTIIGLRSVWLPALEARFGLTAVAHFDPPLGFDSDPVELRRAVDFVLAHPARFIFLAVGSPRQEKLAAAVQATGGATGTALCIGASLEFLAGAAVRAPRWMQHVGLEWLHRLARDPGHLAGRYLRDDPPVLGLLLRARLDRRRRPPGPGHDGAG
jgi:N-acetylglucosaminyldiphosphoundecaprenol N-acetyl-beta-D-mannosaminyltransferase